ncbi:MAG TPA: homoprotocatechuate degradation operon regulator HpaR [Steroidobacteraceae bacterium]|nr:homoprotocatechuate degradation operon regulator HpaR [Steroidobacteraceae bacterium]
MQRPVRRKGLESRAGRARFPRPALPMRAFSDSLPMALLRAREAVMRRFRPGLRGHGVTEQQWRVLRALVGRALEITELADETCLRPPSLSRILPDLESRGFIARRPVPDDLRRATVMLTLTGLELITAHAPESERIYRAIEDRFGAARLAQLFELLKQLERSVAEVRKA